MESIIIILVFVVVIGLFALLFFYLDALPMVELLEKLEYIAQMGSVLVPYVVMSTEEFGEPYTIKTWGITIALMLGCLILTMFFRFCIDWIEERADRRQMKRQKKNKQKAVKNLLGKKTR